MLLRIIFAFLILICISCDKNEECHVPIESKQGQFLVNVNFGDLKGKRLLFDTGAEITVITPKLAKELGVNIHKRHKMVIREDTLEIPFCSLSSVTICNRTCSLPNVAIFDINKDFKDDTLKIDGILGSDYIKNFVITIDYNLDELVFENKNSLKNRISNATKVKINRFLGSVPYITVKKTNHDTSIVGYIIDTGVLYNVIPKRVINIYGENLKMIPFLLKSPFHNENCDKTLIDFGINEDLMINNIHVLTYQKDIGLIGCNYLKNFNITFDYKNKCMYFEKHQ